MMQATGCYMPNNSRSHGCALPIRGVGRRCSCHARTTPTYRIAMVALPRPVAIVCCVSNFVFPGLGTILTGCALCCCCRQDDMDCSEICARCSANVVIGLLQILLTPVFLLGWFWSCLWGVLFIQSSERLSAGREREEKMERYWKARKNYHDGPGDIDHYPPPSVDIPQIVVIESIDTGRRHHTTDPPPRYEILIHESDDDDDLEPHSDDNEPPPPYRPP